MKEASLPLHSLNSPFPEAGMLTELDRIALLHLAAQVPGDIVEIGVNRGLSTRMLATFFPQKTIHAVDFAAGSTLHPGQRSELPRIACEAARHLGNVKVYDVNSQSLDYRSFNANIGLIFIDADHTYEGVKADTERAFEYMRGRAGIVAWHDYSPDCHEWMAKF